MAFSYRKGDIVLIANSTSKMGVSFEKMQVKALMVLRECGDEYIICVPLREKSSTCSIKVEASNCLYAMYSSFCRYPPAGDKRAWCDLCDWHSAGR